MKIKKKIINYINMDVEIIDITLLSVKEYETVKKTYILPINVLWWLRSPGLGSNLATCVRPSGNINVLGCTVNSDFVAVRPALKLKSKDLEVGDEFVFGGKIWTYVGNELAICNKALCEMPFRNDGRADDANIYEVSDVKVFLDEWLKEAEKNG